MQQQQTRWMGFDAIDVGLQHGDIGSIMPAQLFVVY